MSLAHLWSFDITISITVVVGFEDVDRNCKAFFDNTIGSPKIPVDNCSDGGPAVLILRPAILVFKV